jgi:membrane-associated phospholipid phosphatase
MSKAIRYLFELKAKPVKGLLAVEWVVLGYTVLTLVIMLFTITKIHNPISMFVGRLQAVAIIFALWGVYRLMPCRLTHFARIGAQLGLLSWWYPDTYEFNRMFLNLDHLFAGYEQMLFGCQPALTFAQQWSHPVWSELMHLGYSSYFPLIALVTLFYFFCRYDRFNRAAFIILTSFFIYYVIFIFLPVAGPQFYYVAVGTENIAAGVFPDLGHYFADHQEMVTLPGWKDGFFYDLVIKAHEAGERPTAAFPSSHVGITTVLMLLAWESGSRRLFFFMLPFFLLMCLATFYIQAHYVIDVFAGLLSGIVIYAALFAIYNKVRLT